MSESPHVLAPVGSSDHATVIVESKVQAPKKKKAIRKVIVRPLKDEKDKELSHRVTLLNCKVYISLFFSQYRGISIKKNILAYYTDFLQLRC